ncbi:protein PHOSPHATE-INDUCED 1 [Physcomitrium patens]|uniref:Uncharacterized protein n=1 Tax=Physcomitrium patens TaxID=3218 RepID=A0A2K1IXR9_PHYPA|nr:protein EXORDIUM-like [Physcomitrium patens]XP_024356809.1 protein EXORDIUM-like [Physcomitrium patens]XP_024356810.1 protein EXORDIUM-like [Physcomitrium patens]XP_024356811.1 protein EXORDIUM-like [Physcomitrium patens]PNR34079.1 hypothetical protein PHYPA_023895 [Physcomitrium patens]|eukprot:XP_024356807.1 protein EXORDIUM-like [Physcomitrella patens]
MAGRNSVSWHCVAVRGLVFAILVVAGVSDDLSVTGVSEAGADELWAHASRALPFHLFVKNNLNVNSKFLVVDQGPDVKYHKGPILTGDRKCVLKVHVVYYGSWSLTQKAIVHSFLNSFSTPKPATRFPTVKGWWAITKGFRNTKRSPVAPNVVLGSQVHDWKYSLGKNLKQADIEKLVVSSLKKGLVLDPAGLYVVLTGPDVAVQGFCSSLCATHSVIPAQSLTKRNKLPYVWVGNSAKFCGGYCAWPFFKPAPGTGPDTPPLKAPNGDAGVDGMIINIAGMIAGAATNPYGNGYFQGDPRDPLEVAGVCAGTYGPNAFPGYPGDLLVDSKGASFNVHGARGRKYLVPWMYHPGTKQCAGQA